MKSIERKKSIASILRKIILAVAVLQTVLLVLLLLWGGILSKIRFQAYHSFSDRVSGQVVYLETLMVKRWMKNTQMMDRELSKLALDLKEGENGDWTGETKYKLLSEAVPVMLNSLKSAGASGVFFVLDDGRKGELPYSAVYLKDQEPKENGEIYSNISLVVGPGAFTFRYPIGRGTIWSNRLTVEMDGSSDYMKMPMKAFLEGTKKELCGYWSEPFSIVEGETPVITYSLPVPDRNGRICGVAGISINVSYLLELMPEYSLDADINYGYLIGKRGMDRSITPVLMGDEERQSQLLNSKGKISCKTADYSNGISLVTSSKEPMMAAVRLIDVYQEEDYYRDYKWYLASFVKRRGLLDTYNSIVWVLFLSSAAAIVIGIVIGNLAGYKYTRPIRELAKWLENSDIAAKGAYHSSSYQEIDAIANAISQANANFIKSTARLYKIMDRTNIPIGIFEYSSEGEKIYFSDSLLALLRKGKAEFETGRFSSSWREYLDNVMKHKVKTEKDIYRLPGQGEHYVRIDCMENGGSIFGIVEDVTREVTERERIKRQRDYDALTRLCSRTYFEECVVKLMEQRLPGFQAMIMLDLDNFKEVNDTYGHRCGDLYLIRMGELMLEIFSRECVVGRRSGDEFFVYVYNRKSQEEVRILLLQFYQLLDSKEFQFPDGTARSIRVSAGVAWLQEKSVNYNLLLEQADAALYVSKRNDKGIPVQYCDGDVFQKFL